MTFSRRLSEVSDYFSHGDRHLGYRRLLDAAIETGSFGVYEETLRFSDWYDGVDEATGVTPEMMEKVNGLLQAIANGSRETAAERPVKLKAEGLSKKYDTGSFSLAPVDVELKPAQIVGLVGENGNGKTTLLRLLAGELRPTSGSIHYHLEEKASGFYDRRSRMALVPQRAAPWHGPLMSNLQFASVFAGFKGKENFLWTEMMVARMGLRPYRNHSWGRISSGYKMRFELARTLLRRPEILLLDEPLANLDMLAQQIILEDLRFLARSQTMPLCIILSSQQLYEVEKVSDTVIFLRQGKARHQPMAATGAAAKPQLVIELETSASREALQQALGAHRLEKVSFNGGVYILYFDAETALADLFTSIGSTGLPVKYLRDISASSRRFFDA